MAEDDASTEGQARARGGSGDPFLAVDAPELARPFAYVLVGMVALAVAFGMLALSGATGTVDVALGFGLGVAPLVVWLAVRLRATVRDHGVPVDPDDALLDVPVHDASDYAILAIAAVGAAIVYARWDPLAGGADAGPVAVALFAGLVLVAVVALVRLPGVRLLVLADAVVRAPRGLAGPLTRALRSGPAARYPVDDLTLDVQGPVLRLRTGSPLAEWTCLTRRADEVAEAVRERKEAQQATGTEPAPSEEE